MQEDYEECLQHFDFFRKFMLGKGIDIDLYQ